MKPLRIALAQINTTVGDMAGNCERILEAAAQAGASSAFSIPVRLPWEVNPLFQDWLQRHFPDRHRSHRDEAL